MDSQPRQHYFIYVLSFLCLGYLGCEFFINSYAMLTVDEFWFAHRIYQYKDHLPYRDFAPYKTVIGYYLLLIPISMSHGIIGTLVFTKNSIAVLNAIILFISSMWLTRFFSRPAILASLAMLISSDIVLSYSTNIRVDLFAYWLCLFSLLLLLENRYYYAGILIGLGFIISQKVLWYLLASNCALLISWVSVLRDKRIIWNLIRFNFTAFMVILLYILFWSWIANWHSVFTSLFSDATAMYHLDWYEPLRQSFWHYTLFYNPWLFLLCPFTLISLIVTYKDDPHYYRIFIIIYAFTVLLCLIPYKQMFPYYMQVMIPIFFILYAAFFTWTFAILPCQRRFAIPIVLIIIALNFIYPLTFFYIKLIHNNGSYQRANIEALNKLLQDGSDYVAGIDLIYNKSQPIAGIKHLMGPAIAYLYAPSVKLRAVMLPSLDEDSSVTKASVIADLNKSSVKYYVNNYRMHALPVEIKSYLSNQFEHLWGSIYIYAPFIPAGKNSVYIKFSGKYLIEDNSDKTKSIIQLEKGQYIFIAKQAYRLKLMPVISFLSNANFAEDHWEKLAL